MSKSLPLCFPLCVYNFRSSVHILIHFVLIFVCGVREGSNVIVSHVAVSFSQYHWRNCPEQLNNSFLIFPTKTEVRVCFGKLYQLFKCWNSFIFCWKSTLRAKHTGMFCSDGGLPFRSVSTTSFLTSFLGFSNIIDFWVYLLI